MLLRGCIDPSLQISTPGDRTPVAPVPQVCHRPGAVRACAQRAHGVADYHLFSMWRCWPFATLLANALERRVRCAHRERHRESRPRDERMRVSIARRRGGVHERCCEAFARQRAVRRTAPPSLNARALSEQVLLDWLTYKVWQPHVGALRIAKTSKNA